MDKHYTLGVFDYDRVKLCDLYDSQVELLGQAYDIKVTKEINGYHTLEFTIPLMVASVNINDDGTQPVSENFRWNFLQSDYLIRYTSDSETIWYVANKPVKAKSGKEIVGRVTCDGFESLLKTRNIYMEFDDTNGIGTIQYLMEQILKGTGWHFNAHESDTIYENDGETEKVRSLKSDGKKGALDLISTACNIFQARPVFDTDRQEIYIKAMKNRVQVVEGEVGRNLNAISVNQDSSNIATRVYVEGEYGDFGYVGIDDVEVDGEAWGLPFLVNFDYYRKIGVFKQRHEDALATYLHDIREKKAEIRANGALLIATDDSINDLIGQCKVAVYYKSEGFVSPVYTYGGITDEEAELNLNDDVVILKDNNTHSYEKWEEDPDVQLVGAYGVAKFATKAAGKIGAAEVQIESKEKTIEQLRRKISVTVKPDKIAEYEAEIRRLQGEIDIIYNGDSDVTGLYEMMSSLMKSDGLLKQLQDYTAINERLNDEQDEIEATFIAAMGYMLRDGYWNNNNYIVGQEENLYADAVDITKEMSRPATTYSFDYVRVTEDFDIPTEVIDVNAIFKIYDEELDIDGKLFVKKVVFGVDDKSLGEIEVSDQDITLTGNDLGSLLSRMSQLSDLIEQKNALYERSKALTADGSLYTDRLNGQIDVLKTQILSSVSNWYTDDNGNIMFLSADGGSAMMLSGAGFMIADGKTEDGEWNWRSFGDGHGFTADEIVAGFISADRIEAGTISTSKVTADFGRELILSSEQYIQLSATDFDSLGDSGSGIYLSPTQVKINSGGTFELHSTNLDVSTDGTVSARNLALDGGSITLKDNGITKFSVTNNGYMTAKSGQIAGWDIGDTTLTGNKTGLAKTTNDTDIAIWAGDTTAANGNFKVTQGGKLYATGAEISGNSTFAGSLNAATGTFGGTVSAGAVVACDISANNIKGGTLTLGGNNNTSGQITINDASGNQIGSWNNSGISASAGNIGGWYIGQNSLHSGSSGTYVELNSDPTNAYAIWAGNESTGSAPFKVKRTGEVYLTKLIIQKENNSGSGGTYTTEELDLTSNTNRLRGGTLLGWRQDSTTGDTTLYTTYGDLTFNRASLVSGSWTGTTYTAVPDPQGAADAHTSVYLEIEVGGSSVSPNANVNAKIYKDNPGVSTNQLTVKSMTLVENVSAKTVTLETGGLTKGSVSIASTYNAGWDGAIAARVVSGTSTTDQPIKTLGSDEKWKVTFTIPNSAGTDVTSSYVVQAPSDRYSLGWTNAAGDVEMPSAGTGTTFTVKIPNSTPDGAQQTRTFTMTKGTPGTSGYAAVAYNNQTVARIDISDWYNQGVADGEGEFSLASVTLQGSAISGTVYHTVASGGVTYYTAGADVTYYKGDGGTVTVQGNPAGTCYPVVTSGGTVYYTAGSSYTVQGTPAGTCYPVVTSGGTVYYTAGTKYTVQGSSAGTCYPVVSSGGTVYYTAGSSYTVQGTEGPKLKHWGYGLLFRYVNGTYVPVVEANWYHDHNGDKQYYNAGTSSVTAVGSTSIRLGSSGVKYNAGTSTVTAISSTSVRLGTSGLKYNAGTSTVTAISNTSVRLGTSGLKYDAGTITAETRGDSVTVTPIGGTSLMLTPVVNGGYNAGSTVTDTYYTKS